MTIIPFVAFAIGALLAQFTLSPTKQSKPEKPEPDPRDKALEALLKAYFGSSAGKDK